MIDYSDGTTLAVLGLVVGGINVLALTIVQGLIASSKDKREAMRRAADKEQDAKIRAIEKAEDYARQDEVARRAEVAADLLLHAQHESIARTEEVVRVAAKTNGVINTKLNEIGKQSEKIHTLVNSEMTAALSRERDQTKLVLIALRKFQTMSAKSGIESTPEELEAIKSAELRIAELDKILADRAEAQRIVDIEIKKEGDEHGKT